LKIGILTWDLALQGGTQRQIVELARQLKASGDDVTLFAVYFDPSVYLGALEGITVRSLFPGSKIPRGSNRSFLGVNVGAFPLLLEEWRLSGKIAVWVEDRLDVLNVHDNYAFVGAMKWKKRTGKPVVWMMNDFPGAAIPSRRFRSNFLDGLFNSVTGKRWIRQWYRNAVRRLDKVVVLDDRISRRYLEELFQVLPVIIRSGLDLQKFRWEPRPSYRGGRPFALVSNGILLPHRRLEDIAEAVAILAKEGFDAVWSHSGTAELHPGYAGFVLGRVKELGISGRCNFLGKVSDKDLVESYRSADAFVFPNSPQTWGLAVFEAMACGTPVVVSRGAGASEVLTDGVDSLLVDPAHPDQIAEAVRRLAGDPAEWERFSGAGRKFVEENIRWDIYAAKMREEMRALCRIPA
jgi:glycosyltransferase involved in cell wall biosynthesis